MPQQPLEVEHQGAMIRGSIYLPRDDGPFPTVLLLHGFTGHRIETGFLFVELARALVHRGVAAVTFDFLNSGESDGTFADMLVSGELADALHMTGWLEKQPFADRGRLGLLGFSLGGLVAACAAGQTAAYRSLVLIAPTTSKHIARLAADHEPGKGAVVGPHYLHERFGPDVKSLDPLTDCVRHARPTLLVEAGADKAVPASVTEKFAKALTEAKVPLQRHKVRDADHGFSTPACRAELIATVTGWMTAQLV